MPVDGDWPEPPTPDDWLIVPNWEKFQHYGDRNPPWIKLYTKLLSNPDFLDLTLAERGLLMSIWVTYASCSGLVTVKLLSRTVRARYGAHTLIRLNHAGFLYWSASKPLAPKKEKEKEKESPNPLTGKTPDQDLLIHALNVAADWNGSSSEHFDAVLDDLEKQYDAELPTTHRIALWDEALKRNRYPW